MRRTLLTLTLALLALALVPGVATAKQARDRAYGSGTAGPYAFEFDAQSDALGGDATGVFALSVVGDPATAFRGEVTCLQVLGNSARFGGIVTESTFGSPVVGDEVTFSVLDGGQADVFSGTGGIPLCSPFSVVSFPVDSGNIVVEDAQCDTFKDKPGTDKDKCKDKNKP